MAWASVDRAFALRLMGRPPTDKLDGDGFVSAGSWGRSKGAKPVKLGNLDISADSLRTVPLYRFSSRGQPQINTFPAVAYTLSGMDFNTQRYIYREDEFVTPVKSSYVKLDDGRTGPTLLRNRKHPDPYDLTFDVRIQTADDIDGLVILQALQERLPMRDQLTVVQADGTLKIWNMYNAGIVNQDDSEPTVEDNDQRLFTWVLSYVVETHLDNSNVSRTSRTVVEVLSEYEII